MKYLQSVLTIFSLTPFLFACSPRPQSQEEKTLHVSSVAESLQFKHTIGNRGQTWILIHGLGDDMSKLDQLAGLARQNGYSVLQMDLYGHGLTLTEYLEHHSKLPETFDYEKNVIGIKALLEQLNINDELVIVGHSYGGAIAYALAADLEKSRPVRSVHLLAPYVQRIDKFMKTNLNPYRDPRWDDITDPLLDPILESYMRKNFRAYLESNYFPATRARLTVEQKKELDYKVEAAIRVTKGIRRFDLLEKTKPLLKVSSPLQIIGGKSDELVKPVQLQAFERRLKEEKIPHSLEFLEGREADHLFPRKNPSVVYDKIESFRAQFSSPN